MEDVFRVAAKIRGVPDTVRDEAIEIYNDMKSCGLSDEDIMLSFKQGALAKEYAAKRVAKDSVRRDIALIAGGAAAMGVAVVAYRFIFGSG